MAREERGLSQEALGKAVGVTREAVSNWEKDKSRPDPKRWPRIVELLGLQPDVFMEGMPDVSASHQDARPAQRTEAEINAGILRDISRQVMDYYDRGELDMTPRQFGQLVERLYLRIQELPPSDRADRARTILDDMLALARRD